MAKKNGSNRALVSVNLSTVHFLTANYGFHYTQNLIKKAAETLSRLCTEKCLLFKTYENRFVFYLNDYEDKKELSRFVDAVAQTLGSLFVTERIGGGIGILDIGPKSTVTDADLLLRNLLIASERAVAVSEKDFEVCFYDENLEALVNRERDIRDALTAAAEDADTGDGLYLQYQPILNLKTDAVCGFEVLARMKTVKQGTVSPSEFIPIAEKTKLILPVGEKIMDGALRFLNRLAGRGYDSLRISVNISAVQLLGPDFADRLLGMIGCVKASPENIVIEITESVFVSDYVMINGIIEKLRDAGLQTAIDDFGTGYSSLAREKELNADCLKIDKYFIGSLTDTDPDSAITGDIISMAHKLGYCVVAEGVEDENQLLYLKKNGCDMAQGYLIGRPLDEEDAFEFLKRRDLK